MAEGENWDSSNKSHTGDNFWHEWNTPTFSLILQDVLELSRQLDASCGGSHVKRQENGAPCTPEFDGAMEASFNASDKIL